jgi:hypothetical protein
MPLTKAGRRDSTAASGDKTMPRFRLLVLPIALMLVLSQRSSAFCRDPGTTGDALRTSQEAEVSVRLAPVVIDGETLFSVRGASAYPAERRAQEITERILAVAANRDID